MGKSDLPCEETSCDFRTKCFAKQTQYLSAGVRKWFSIVGAMFCICWALEIIPLAGLLVRSFYLVLLYLAISPTSIARKKMKVRQIEARSFVAMLATLLCGGFYQYSIQDVTEGIVLHRHGLFALWNKLLLIPIHFSDCHFWVLNVVDYLVWLSTRPDGLPLKMALPGGLALACIAAVQRHLVDCSLMAVFSEAQRRERAERAKQRFHSYIMHEMRNPLSGAALLLVEFRGILSDLAASAAGKVGALPESVKRETARLLILTGMLGGQFDKMRGVCDDVLQLEKLDKGGFSFVFSSQDIQLWVREVAEKQQLLMEGTDRNVKFVTRWEVEGEDVQRLLKSRPLGVADFTRLEQVIDNFVGNARKFTREGEICLDARLRAPSPTEHRQLKDLLAVSHRTDSDSHSDSASSQGGGGSDRDRELSPDREAGESPEGEIVAVTAGQWVDAMRELLVLDSDHGGGADSEAQAGSGPKTDPAQKDCSPAISKGKKRHPQQKEPSRESAADKELGLEGLQWVVFRLIVTDTGPGLSREDIGKSFVKAHGGGQIGAQSEGRGKGGQFYFQIFLPLVASSPEGRETDGIEQPSTQKIAATPFLQASDLTPALTPLSASPASSRSHDTPRRRRLAQKAYENFTFTVDSSPLAFAFQSQLDKEASALRMEGRNKEADDSLTVSVRRCTKGGTRELEMAARERRAELPSGFQVSEAGLSPPHLCSPSWSGQYQQQYTADVLVVDDDQFCLIAAEAAVRRMGYSVETAADGRDAVNLIVKQKKRYRLILMDNNMGGLDGPSATEAVVGHFAEEHARRMAGVSERSQKVLPSVHNITPSAKLQSPSRSLSSHAAELRLSSSCARPDNDNESVAATAAARAPADCSGPPLADRGWGPTEAPTLPEGPLASEANREPQIQILGPKEKAAAATAGESFEGRTQPFSQTLQVPFILGCTADTSAEVERRFLEAGAAGMMRKPVKVAQITEWLTRLRKQKKK
uniref:histidine kinase n=1 Tax=Chromera velia CCMP2878 TaxID=1169474 RepID=A0A0G4GY13_9ALVE|eukprot:Cvel_23858.t1-p1 / transcript=Cvel_23858.t1 / gene=Cvel_23858 / organism=Chromera_velia_CCMP2878 / gene_product=hypothetical protein / transcript_product=hypothetical protein / location=Cvel_scaffold2510:14474-19208(+) / protein_length=982 / sequence_SO=supercontig / SO=protein_coding / is_pseudo=false